MASNGKKSERKAEWKKPQVARLEAGAAETMATANTPDGGSGS